MRLRIDLKIFILAFLFIITNQIKIYAMIMIFAIIHEIGHLFVGVLLGMKPEKMELKPFGVSIEFTVSHKDYNKKIIKGNLLEIKKIIIACAGPFTNGIIILILKYLNLSQINYEDKILIIYSNLMLLLFNILPIYPLDGGRILKSLLYLFNGKKLAEKNIYYISYITLIILTIISSITILYVKNIAIFLVIMFLWGLQIKENKIYQNRKKLYKMIYIEKKEYQLKDTEIPAILHK